MAVHLGAAGLPNRPRQSRASMRPQWHLWPAYCLAAHGLVWFRIGGRSTVLVAASRPPVCAMWVGCWRQSIPKRHRVWGKNCWAPLMANCYLRVGVLHPAFHRQVQQAPFGCKRLRTRPHQPPGLCQCAGVHEWRQPRQMRRARMKGNRSSPAPRVRVGDQGHPSCGARLQQLHKSRRSLGVRGTGLFGRNR